MTHLSTDGHFLSAANPSATVDQRTIEALAIDIAHRPDVLKAKQAAAGRWKIVMGSDVSPEAWSRFDRFMDEWAFSHVLKAVNSDSNYPKILGHMFGPPHEWFGMKVPGSRGGGGDSPDINYMFAPIDSCARFEIHGRCFNPRPADAPFVVTGDISLASTLSMLDWQDVEIASDGSFVITIGPEAADGRANHIQTKLEARFLTLRDVRSDWRQVSTAYRIKRLDPPTAPPITEEQMAERAAHFMVYEVPAMYFFNRVMAGIPMNSMSPAFNTGTVGGLTHQMASFGRMRLSDDDALVVEVGGGNAAYHSLVLIDHYWHSSFDAARHTSSMNKTQTVKNADGSMTYVVSVKDPGVYNWLDPVGSHEVSAIHRWQGIPRENPASAMPWIKSALVKCADLPRVLPPETKYVSPQERQVQISQRTETFMLRYVDR